MDLAFSPEDLAFQHEVRDWIATAYDDDLRRKMAQSKNGYLDKAGQVKWQKKLFERGWVAPDWPVAGSMAHSEKVEYCGRPSSLSATPSAARCCAAAEPTRVPSATTIVAPN